MRSGSIAFIFIVFLKFYETTSVGIISITPSSTCLATGLTNVVATAAFEQQAIISSCTWVYGGPLEGTMFYTAAFGCAGSISNLGDTVTCSQQNIDGVPYLNTTLTIGNPLSAGILSLGISCSSINASLVITPPTITRMVAGCSASPNSGVVASCGSSCGYDSVATLSCDTGYRGDDVNSTCQYDCTFIRTTTCTVIASSAIPSTINPTTSSTEPVPTSSTQPSSIATTTTTTEAVPSSTTTTTVPTTISTEPVSSSTTTTTASTTISTEAVPSRSTEPSTTTTTTSKTEAVPSSTTTTTTSSSTEAVSSTTQIATRTTHSTTLISTLPPTVPTTVQATSTRTTVSSTSTSSPARGRCTPKCHRFASCKKIPVWWVHGGLLRYSYKCKCNNGYRGNGVSCYVQTATQTATTTTTTRTTVSSTSTSSPARDRCPLKCRRFASCKKIPVRWIDGQFLRYKCECNEGYYGNGVYCYARDQCAPVICHDYAKCQDNGWWQVRRGRYWGWQSNHKCVCRYGYVGNGTHCTARDQCDNTCHEFAKCRWGHSGGYQCECNHGYMGNGRYCRTRDQCDSTCHQFAKCKWRHSGGYQCECNHGYMGNGRICRTRDQCDNTCHQFAKCKWRHSGGYQCECNHGYMGNGRYCRTRDQCDNTCHQFAKCRWRHSGGYQCKCNHGYMGNGRYCRILTTTQTTTTTTTSSPARDQCTPPCHRRATCDHKVRWIQIGNVWRRHWSYKCFCGYGYVRNGIYCQARDQCRESCHKFASCKKTYHGDYKCECKQGYQGSGRSCWRNESCKQRCGQPYNSNKPCQCNKWCSNYGDCCYDYQQHCEPRYYWRGY